VVRRMSAACNLTIGSWECRQAATSRGPVSGRDSIEVDGFILQLGGKTAMRNLLLAIMVFMTVPVTVIAGPKEDAYQIVEKFKRAFDVTNRAVEPCASRIL